MTSVMPKKPTTDLIDNDYVLVEGAAWFDVDGFTIRIHSTDEGVVVDVFDAKLCESGDFDVALMATTYVFNSELSDADEKAETQEHTP